MVNGSAQLLAPAKFPRVLVRILIAGVILGVLYLSISGHFFSPLFKAYTSSHYSELVYRPSLIWALMGVLLLLFRIILWVIYKPFKLAPHATLPMVTVVIPAYNEGPMVARTIDSVAMANYPPEKLQIFAIDDGSKDDTWSHIERAAAKYPHLVSTLKLEKNGGKRAALENGFRRAKGEILITVDSDSEIEPNTILAAVAPFQNPRVGAVAGKVAVLNREQGIIPLMLHVRFILSFDFLRATQSVYGTVYCCPGALAAYRATAVHQVLDAWANQKFLGRRCTFGEDRAMTNLILRAGFDTAYQRTAIVFTVVPWTYKKLYRMYLRWDRSYIREEILLARYVWKRRFFPMVISIFDRIITNLRYPVGYLSLALFISASFNDPSTVLRMLAIIGIVALVNMYFYLHTELSWDFLYGILYAYFSFFALFWVFPYAMVTLRSRSWMTR
jgi:hyaluronan synthase